ncbi:hypothetical protein ACROYT_G019632 [Oculina patagonica]
MSLLFNVAFLLAVAASSEACSCMPFHPQEGFCAADFVVRAKVLSQEIQGESLVISLRILKTYKGASELNQTEGIQVYGSRQRSLFAKAYTPKESGICAVDWLTNDTVYLISGKIINAKLRLHLCSSWVEEWSQVTQRQRVGVRRFYAPNCGCQISPCYGNHCPKLSGCRLSQYMNPRGNDCEWRHSYCLKNADGTACSWRETAEYKNCTSNAMIP